MREARTADAVSPRLPPGNAGDRNGKPGDHAEPRMGVNRIAVNTVPEKPHRIADTNDERISEDHTNEMPAVLAKV